MIKSFWNLFESRSDVEGLDFKKAPAWRPLGRLPNWSSSLDCPGVHNRQKKVNRYLRYQESRLKKLHVTKNFHSIVILWFILLKTSKSYQVTLFNRTYPEWYWKVSTGDSFRILKTFMNQIRKWDLTLELKRFYILKKSGKFRPIGSPTLASRMISKSLNDLLYFTHEDKLATYQHAYRLERGTHTALLEIWLRITNLNQTCVYEFDFQTYFNSVKTDWVIAYLKRRSTILSLVINRVLHGIRYTFDRDIRLLPEEAEMRLLATKHWGPKPKLVRKGLPQGLSISPLLATMVLDSLPAVEGLVMYADDGVILSETEDDTKINKWFESLEIFGIKLEPTKSGRTKGSFKFCGVTFDIGEETVSWEGHNFSWKGRDVNATGTLFDVWGWFRTVSQYYGKKSVGWTWEIDKLAAINEFKGTEGNWWHWLKIVWAGVWSAESYKGERYFIGKGIYNISSSSTRCCDRILGRLKDFRLVKIKEFNWVGDSYARYLYSNRGKYWERSNYVTDLMDLMVGVNLGAGVKFPMIKKPLPKIVGEKSTKMQKQEPKIIRVETNRYKYKGKKLPWLQTKVGPRKVMAITKKGR